MSTVHCTSIGSIALYWLHFLYTRCDSNAAYVTGAMPYSGVVSSVSIGYFVWDTLYLVLMDRSVMRQWQHEQALAAVANAKSAQPHLMTLPKAPKPCADWKMLLHHVLAALGQYASVSTKGLPVCYVCLLVMECTTTLLNTTWLRRKAGLDSGAFHKMLEVIFVLLWVPLRLVIPGYCIVYMQRDFAVIWDTAPPLPLYTGFVMIPFLNILNWIWFIQIIKIISGINDKAKSG